MPGGGTKLAITTNNLGPPPARLLDLSRSLSRAGRVPTGVDRVEHAYLAALLDDPVPLFAIARTSFGYVLTDRDGARFFHDRLTGAVPWGPADWLSRGFSRRDPVARAAETDLRRVAIARCLPRGVGRMLARHLPPGTAWINTGHTNLTTAMFAAVKALGGRATVMIHDTIPLDAPHFQRPGVPEAFAALLRRVAADAALVLCNSAHTRDRLAHHMDLLPPTRVVPLGVSLARPDATALPPSLDLRRPYFVTLGTIEPRKDHGLLLDVWEDMARDRLPAEIPGLMICGARGWENTQVFRRLDALPPGGPVRELPGLPDAAVAALLIRSRGLLFPSQAEGYGLPPIEAAALGVPVALRDLPVYRETLGDIAVYAGESDRYSWRKIVESLLRGPAESTRAGLAAYAPPTWEAHFKAVLSIT